MKIATIMAEKGGVGKTTVLYNFAEWLSAPADVVVSTDAAGNPTLGQNKKVLLMDFDQQASLTETYATLGAGGSTENMFLDQPVEIQHVRENLDIIAGSYELEQAAEAAMLKNGREMLLYWYMADHAPEYDWDRYDYILMDTHPDFSVINQNVAVTSNIIVSPLEPSKYGVSAKEKIESRLGLFKQSPAMRDRRTGESFVTAELVFFNNLIAHNESASQRLLQATVSDPTVVATIQKRTAFPQSVEQSYPLVAMAQDSKLLSKYRKFFNEINEEFVKIKTAIDLAE
jgi:ATPases involved in chromosome partitioning